MKMELSPYMTKLVNKIINSQWFIFLKRFPPQTKFEAKIYCNAIKVGKSGMGV